MPSQDQVTPPPTPAVAFSDQDDAVRDDRDGPYDEIRETTDEDQAQVGGADEETPAAAEDQPSTSDSPVATSADDAPPAESATYQGASYQAADSVEPQTADADDESADASTDEPVLVERTPAEPVADSDAGDSSSPAGGSQIPQQPSSGVLNGSEPTPVGAYGTSPSFGPATGTPAVFDTEPKDPDAEATDVTPTDADRTDVEAADVAPTDAELTDAERTDVEAADAASAVTVPTETQLDADERTDEAAGDSFAPSSVDGAAPLEEPALGDRPGPDEGAIPAGEQDAGTGEQDAGTGEQVAGTGEAAELSPGDVELAPVAGVWPADVAEALRQRWHDLQLRFVDDPHEAAAEADFLVGEAIETLTGSLASLRTDLSQWRSEGAGDTEELRVAVQRYREFLDRILGL